MNKWEQFYWLGVILNSILVAYIVTMKKDDQNNPLTNRLAHIVKNFHPVIAILIISLGFGIVISTSWTVYIFMTSSKLIDWQDKDKDDDEDDEPKVYNRNSLGWKNQDEDTDGI